MKSPRTYSQTDRRKFFLLVLSSKTYKTWTFVQRTDFFFHSCDYNTFSFYILRIWWESKNKIIGHRIDLTTSLSKRCDWLEIVPLIVQPGSGMFALRQEPRYYIVYSSNTMHYISVCHSSKPASNIPVIVSVVFQYCLWILTLRGRTGTISSQAKFHFKIPTLRYQFIATNIITFVLKQSWIHILEGFKSIRECFEII